LSHKCIAVPASRNRSNRKGKSNNSSNCNRNRKNNRKGIRTVAIVHVVLKSSSTAPPSAAHAQYIARDGQYARRGGLELAESGNMPEFAQANPLSFWAAADAHERKNGRAYTELQIALPRELNPEQRNELAREATRELLGDRFAYTLAVHTPLAKDNIEQPHMHLMFSERVVDSNTQSMPEEQFFKRNGAKKDRSWNDQNKPLEVREKWVEMMNGAMERHGQEQRLDARSWKNQGRHDLAELVEPKLLAGNEAEARQLHAQVDALREQRAELPAPGLSAEAAAQEIVQTSERKIAEVHQREAQELSRLDKLIAAARELAVEVKERATEMVRNVTERIDSFLGRGKEQEQARPPTLSVEERLEQKLSGLDKKMAAQESLEDRLAGFEKRMDTQVKMQQEQQEKELSKQQKLEISRDRGGHSL
jgi:predicted GIY-YIG superfamily endonuclease